MTIVKSYDVAGEIQLKFAWSKRTLIKTFFWYLTRLLRPEPNYIGHIFFYFFFSEFEQKLKTLSKNIVFWNIYLLMWTYFHFSGSLSWFLTSKFSFENWMCPIFDSSRQSYLNDIKNSLGPGTSDSKNILNSTCLTLKLHNRLYATTYLYYSTKTTCSISIRFFF